MLMVVTEPHPMAAPYPDNHLRTLNRVLGNTNLTHFRDCSRRSVRDCGITLYAENLLAQVESLIRTLLAQEVAARKKLLIQKERDEKYIGQWLYDLMMLFRK